MQEIKGYFFFLCSKSDFCAFVLASSGEQILHAVTVLWYCTMSILRKNTLKIFTYNLFETFSELSSKQIVLDSDLIFFFGIVLLMHLGGNQILKRNVLWIISKLKKNLIFEMLHSVKSKGLAGFRGNWITFLFQILLLKSCVNKEPHTIAPFFYGSFVTSVFLEWKQRRLLTKKFLEV